MFRKKERPSPARESRPASDGPRLIRINPDGRREVDPMSIIQSERGRKHLNDIKGIVPTRESGEP